MNGLLSAKTLLLALSLGITALTSACRADIGNQVPVADSTATDDDTAPDAQDADPPGNQAPTGQATLSGRVVVGNAAANENAAVADPDGYAYGLTGAIVEAVLEGETEAATETDADGYWTLVNLTPGLYIIRAQHQDNGSVQVVSTSEVIVSGGQEYDLGEMTMEVLGALTGHVILEGQTDNSAALAYLPGTGFVSITGASGEFTLLYIPAGVYDFTASKPGYETVDILDVVIEAGHVTDLGEVILPAIPLPDPCVDTDGDGRGNQCAAGPDCDDANSTVWSDCENSGCTDGDDDSRTGYSASVCITGDDHCDADAFNWSLIGCAYCQDLDSDGYGTFCDLGNDCDDADIDVWNSCAPAPTCTDNDTDGYGAGCIGPDCDDNDITIWANCENRDCADSDGDGRNGYNSQVCVNGSDYCDADVNNWSAMACASCIDIDGDGRGDFCDLGADCDNTDVTVWTGCVTPPACIDADVDTYGANCAPGPDCDDTDGSIHTDCENRACADIDGDGANGFDAAQCVSGTDSCDDDSSNWTALGCAYCIDADLDGYGTFCDPGLDCDDADALIWVGCPPPPTCTDADGDGFGQNCPAGDDCNDFDVLVNPLATEIPGDGIDNDCDGYSAPALGGDGYVDQNDALCNDTGPGSIAEPFCSVVAATDFLRDNIYVAQGVYREVEIDYSTNLYGGYATGGTQTWTRDVDAHQTTILSQAVGISGISVLIGAGDLLIDGFKIQGESSGIGTDSTAVYLVAGAVTISDCRLLGGTPGPDAASHSRGIEMDNGVLKVSNSIIEAGDAPNGNAWNITIANGRATLINNVLLGSTSAVGNTAGAISSFGNLTAVGNKIFCGSAGQNCYGFIIRAESLLVNNTVIPGTAALNSHAIHNALASGNVIAINNHFESGGAAGADTTLVNGVSTYEEMRNNNVYGPPGYVILQYLNVSWYTVTTVSAFNACGWSGCLNAEGNISVGPGHIVAGGDVQLQAGSALIDAGIDPSPWYPYPITDMDGDIRPQGGGWDIGADEYIP